MISIFAKQAFLNVNPSQSFVFTGEKPKRGHLQRVSSMIRGDQVADEIGAKFNPESGYENDICIYVKPHIKKNNIDFQFEGRKAYIDIIDGHNLGQLMVRYPKVGVIVCSQADMEVMTGVIPNDIVCIPQHHCNFDRLQRKSDGIRRIGLIGTEGAWPFLPSELDAELERRGIEIVKFSKFFTRQDIIDFYMSIDLQMVWRPYKKILSNPLKLVNAASFGIPTIALDERAFKELDGYYYGVQGFPEFLSQLDTLRADDKQYKRISELCYAKAEDYHINNIGKRYKELDK